MKKNLLNVFRMLFTLLLLLSVTGNLFAQRMQVTGKIMDEAKSTIPGASVMIKGTTVGVSSQTDGTFSIAVQKGQILVFRSVGYVSQEVTEEHKPYYQ